MLVADYNSEEEADSGLDFGALSEPVAKRQKIKGSKKKKKKKNRSKVAFTVPVSSARPEEEEAVAVAVVQPATSLSFLPAPRQEVQAAAAPALAAAKGHIPRQARDKEMKEAREAREAKDLAGPGQEASAQVKGGVSETEAKARGPGKAPGRSKAGPAPGRGNDFFRSLVSGPAPSSAPAHYSSQPQALAQHQPELAPFLPQDHVHLPQPGPSFPSYPDSSSLLYPPLPEVTELPGELPPDFRSFQNGTAKIIDVSLGQGFVPQFSSGPQAGYAQASSKSKRFGGVGLMSQVSHTSHASTQTPKSQMRARYGW